MIREYILKPDVLRRILNEEQFRLPLSCTTALHAAARLHGFNNWNAAAASNLSKGLKRRAKVLRGQLGAHADASLLKETDLAAICAAVGAIELNDMRIEECPSVLAELSAEEAELLGLLGAGASTAELYELLGGTKNIRTMDIHFTLSHLESKIGAYSDPARDEFARKHGFVQQQHIQRLAILRVKRKPVMSRPTGLSLVAGVTLADFRNLIAKQDDNRGHHMLWVDRSGMIHLDMVPNSMSPSLYEREIDNQMQFRCATFVWGGGDMGRAAAENITWSKTLLDSLKRHWDSSATGYIEND